MRDLIPRQMNVTIIRGFLPGGYGGVTQVTGWVTLHVTKASRSCVAETQPLPGPVEKVAILGNRNFAAWIVDSIVQSSVKMVPDYPGF